MIRYFFIANAPEKRDADFSWREFINNNNGELLGAYGNLVNRTLVFVKKYFNNIIPNEIVNEEIRRNVEQLYKSVGSSIEKGNLKTAIEEVFEFIRSINKYFDEKKPWITVNSNNDECSDSIYNCLFSIINIANLLNPFLPSSSHKVKTWLGCDVNNSRSVDLKVNIVIGEFEILFQRLDKKLID